jgi:cobalt-zinc-cadmium efflux system outer membrane protein
MASVVALDLPSGNWPPETPSRTGFPERWKAIVRAATLLILSCTPVSAACGATAQPPTLSVEEAVAHALRANPVMRAGAYEVAAARSGVSAARALANPTLTVAPSVAGPAGSDEELMVAQPLEVSGTRAARTRIARAGLRATESEARSAARDLVRDVRLAYYELVRARDVLALQQESVGYAQEFERIARRQVELGARPGIDLTQLQIELTRARQQQVQAESSARRAEAVLNTLMGHAPGAPIGAVSRLTFAPGPTEGSGSRASDATNAALARRPEIAAQEAALEAARQQIRLTRAEGQPDLALTGRLESFTERPRAGGMGVAITLPLFDHGGRRSRIRQAERESLAQAARVEAARAVVRGQVVAAYERLGEASRLVRGYEEGLLDQARRLADAERTRFQTGAGSPLTVLEAQRTYRSVLSDYYGSLAAYAQAKAELEWALGEGPDHSSARAGAGPAPAPSGDPPGKERQ